VSDFSNPVPAHNPAPRIVSAHSQLRPPGLVPPTTWSPPPELVSAYTLVLVPKTHTTLAIDVTQGPILYIFT
jgi:hypothetical protein